MKVNKEIINEITRKIKEHPCSAILSGMGASLGIILTIALGGLGYMIDTKNDMYEEMFENENNENENKNN